MSSVLPSAPHSCVFSTDTPDNESFMRLQLLDMWGGKQMITQTARLSPRFADPVVSLCDGRCCLKKWTVIPRISGLCLLPLTMKTKWKTDDFSRLKDTGPKLTGLSCIEVAKLFCPCQSRPWHVLFIPLTPALKTAPFLPKYWNYYSSFLKLNFLSDQDSFSLVFY